MEISTIDFVKKLAELRKVSECVYPEQWNFICATHDISVANAQTLLEKYQHALCGKLPYKDNEVDEDTLAMLFALAEETYQFYKLPPSPRILNVRGFDKEDRLGIKVFWKNKTGELQSLEGNIRYAEIYREIVKLMDAGMEIVAIVRQVDSESSAFAYIGDDKPADEQNWRLKIYEGDVFAVYSNKYHTWHPEENGVYIATADTGYRRLVYTPGKGYIRKGELDVDEDFAELPFGEENLYKCVLFSGHRFRRIGNVHVSLDFLREERKEDGTKVSS